MVDNSALFVEMNDWCMLVIVNHHVINVCAIIIIKNP